MALVTTVWGIRLTYNFLRRGGYTWPPWSGDEDYRWDYIRQGHFWEPLTNPVAWHLFNLLFISIYQNILLYLIAAPSVVAHVVATRGTTTLGTLDWVAATLVLLFICIESVADNQQCRFQMQKYAMIKRGDRRSGDFARGFLTAGLFSIVRKPNYAAEQAIWISYYLFTVSIELWNWSIIGCILLCLLFQGSGWFTEKLTLQKYPEYANYQQKVPLYVPSLSLIC